MGRGSQGETQGQIHVAQRGLDVSQNPKAESSDLHVSIFDSQTRRQKQVPPLLPPQALPLGLLSA